MLEIDGVVKSYDPFRLGPIDLSVGDEVVAILGPSGCGKSTLLAAIAGLIQLDGGRIRLNGMDLTHTSPEDRGTALVFQDGALFPHLTARENIAYAGSSDDLVVDLADRLDIAGVLDQPAPTLSGGQRQRVALARALAADPDALLLDEPLANLDEPIKRRLRGEMRDLLVTLGVPTVYVTHDQRGATALGDRIAVMEGGRFHQVDTPKAVFEQPTTPFVAAFTGAANVFEATVEEGEKVLQWGDCRIPFDPPTELAGQRVRFCIRPEHVEVLEGETAPDGVLDATIMRRTFEGGDYRLEITANGAPQSVELAVRAPQYDQLGLDHRESIRVVFPREAIHVMDASSATTLSD